MIGGRRVEGQLVSYDTALNLILDTAIESSPYRRNLGLCIVRGNQLQTLCQGMDGISNPFI